MRDVEWIITEKCNFRCSYCHCDTGPHAVDDVVEAVLHYIAFVFKADRVNLCGGEPIIAPSIKRVARYLKDHGIPLSTDSNISLPLPRILEILEEGGSNFHYVHTTLHPEFHDFGDFCTKVRAIRDTGRRVDVRLIAIHDQWDRVQTDFARLIDAGMQPKLKLEKYRRRDGFTVPRNILPPYSEEQLRWIAATMDCAVDGLLEEYAYHSFTGQPCSAGWNSVYIDAGGLVYRCTGAEKAGDPLGHASTLGPPERVRRSCTYAVCPCREVQRLGLLMPGAAQADAAGGLDSSDISA